MHSGRPCAFQRGAARVFYLSGSGIAVDDLEPLHVQGVERNRRQRADGAIHVGHVHNGMHHADVPEGAALVPVHHDDDLGRENHIFHMMQNAAEAVAEAEKVVLPLGGKGGR